MDRISREYIGFIAVVVLLVAGGTVYVIQSSSNVEQWSGQVEQITYWNNSNGYVINESNPHYRELKYTLLDAIDQFDARLTEANLMPCIREFREGRIIQLDFNESIEHTQPPYNGSSRSFIFKLNGQRKIHPVAPRSSCGAFGSSYNWKSDVNQILNKTEFGEPDLQEPRREGPLLLHEFETNQSTVSENGELYVSGTTSPSVEYIRIGDAREHAPLFVYNGSFSGWIYPILDDYSFGTQTVEVLVTIGEDRRKNHTVRTLQLNVTPMEDTPPVVRHSSQHDDRISTGEDLTLTVSASDERNVTDLTVRFRNQLYTDLNPVRADVSLETSHLSPGTYTYNVTATDNAGHTTTEHAEFTVED